MKMLKVMTFALCIIYSVAVKAQETINSATWKETINFIRKYKNHLAVSDKKTEVIIRDESLTFKINEQHKVQNCEGKYFITGIDCSTTINLLKLQSVNIIDSDIIKLRLTGDYISKKCFDVLLAASRNYYTSCIADDVGVLNFNNQSSINISFNDIEMSKRLTKAFQHLVYLSKKKRSEEQKKSGDKF